MRNKGLHYINPNLSKRISSLVDEFSAGTLKIKPDEFPFRLKKMLPIDKLDRNTVCRRVEGFFHASNLLFDRLISDSALDRKQIIARADLKPMGYYHYFTGSREPADYMKTRDDLLNDPTAALVKLSNDIIGMATLMRELHNARVVVGEHNQTDTTDDTSPSNNENIGF
jgi:hypothetical protein